MTLGARAVVALDAAAAAAAVVAPGLRGWRVRSLEKVALPPEALLPSPRERNLVRPDDVKEALRALAARCSARRALLVLPDGLARFAVLEVPPRVEPREFARYRLAPTLGYPAADAVVDGLELGRGRFLAAAVRRATVEEYERALAAAGFRPQRVDLTPLAALAALRRRPAGPGFRVEVILGDTALSLAAFEGATLRVFRNRLRQAGDPAPQRLQREVDRTALLAGDGAAPARVRVVGPGARDLIRELAFAGREAGAGWELPGLGGEDAAELSWLGAALP